jgi:hypothetical protein
VVHEKRTSPLGHFVIIINYVFINYSKNIKIKIATTALDLKKKRATQIPKLKSTKTPATPKASNNKLP